MSETQDNPSIADLFWEVRRRLVADEAIPLAGNIAFRIVFSAFPFLIFLTALAGFFGNAEWAESAVNFLLSVAPENLVKPLAGEIRSILTVQRSGLLSIAALLTVWSAMGGVDSVRVGLNRAYDVPEHRTVWLLYAIDVLFVVATAFILLAVASLIIFFPVALKLINTFAGGLPASLLQVDQFRFPLALLLLLLGVHAAHRILPAKRLGWRDVWPGVLLTIIGWVVMAVGFSNWLLHFNSFASTYASLSGIFAAMFFVYLAALLLILGGELNRVLQLVRQNREIREKAIRGKGPDDVTILGE
jgi:membrane protein